MITPAFLNAVQARTARISVSASATRKQGGGVIEPARAFLGQLALRDFALSDNSAFETLLNNTTANLASTFPAETQCWGLARKLLNIFLRDTLYTTYLAEAYELIKVEPLLEVPLDSIHGPSLFQNA